MKVCNVLANSIRPTRNSPLLHSETSAVMSSSARCRRQQKKLNIKATQVSFTFDSRLLKKTPLLIFKTSRKHLCDQLKRRKSLRKNPLTYFLYGITAKFLLTGHCWFNHITCKLDVGEPPTTLPLQHLEQLWSLSRSHSTRWRCSQLRIMSTSRRCLQLNKKVENGQSEGSETFIFHFSRFHFGFYFFNGRKSASEFSEQRAEQLFLNVRERRRANKRATQAKQQNCCCKRCIKSYKNKTAVQPATGQKHCVRFHNLAILDFLLLE